MTPTSDIGTRLVESGPRSRATDGTRLPGDGEGTYPPAALPRANCRTPAISPINAYEDLGGTGFLDSPAQHRHTAPS
jgi:hypothetical protein